MRRYLISIVALVLVGVLAFALAGCGGGSEATAKEYMENGDEIIDGLEEESEDLESVLNTVFTELSTGNVTSSEVVNGMIDDLDKTSADALKEAEKAKAEFEKILDLEGVDDYKEYAELRIAVIDGIESLIKETGNYLSSLSEVLTDAEQGQQVDLDSVQSGAEKFFAKIMSLQEQVTEDGEKADELARELK
jgi:valyl-tRNA synthetase